MPEIKQIDWAKFGYQQPAPNVKTYKIKAKNGKVKTFNARPKKRTHQEKLAIRDYYNTIDKIRATINED